MKKLLVVAIICGVASASYVFAQDEPAVPKPQYTRLEALKRIRPDIQISCVLSDKTEHLVSTTVTVAGRTYRCVTVLDENLNRVGAAWTPEFVARANGR